MGQKITKEMEQAWANWDSPVTLDAIKVARWRFNRDKWRGYFGNRWRPDRRGWRKVISNVKMLCDKRGLTLKDFGL